MPQFKPLNDNLTPNFTLTEMCFSDTANLMGIDNTPHSGEVECLVKTCEALEKIRTLCGDNPVIITSGFRCEALNNAVGGASNSAHRYGYGADFVIPEFGTPTEICNHIAPHLYEIGIDQLINESSDGGAWVHVGLCEGEPRCECLTISPAGTQTGIV
jgi:zinc D-Ala-D-Ala carboxypeptidase